MDIINGYGTAIDDADNGVVTPNWEFHLMKDKEQYSETEYRVNIWKAASILNTTVQNSKDTSLSVKKLRVTKKNNYSNIEDGSARNLYFIQEE